jgi:hypothetical protein
MQHPTADAVEGFGNNWRMSLSGELARFETLLAARFPTVLAEMNPGLDDERVARLREALLPMGLTDEIETLYRWHDGGAPYLFGGWQFLPIDWVLDEREFYLEELEEPPAWLRIFDDHSISFVSLDVLGYGSHPGVWYGHTHDGWLSRLFLSIESMVATCSDAIEAGLLIEVGTADWSGLRMSEESSLDSLEFTPLRVAREAVTFVYPDPPTGTYLTREADVDWPRPWLASLGLDPSAPELTGATSTISELIARSSDADASGTILASVTRFGFGDNTWFATVDDGTGELFLVGPKEGLYGPRMGQRAEFDVNVMQPRGGDEDLRTDHPIFTARMFPGVLAHPTAVRRLPN